jgi:hypothetical protein
LLTLTHSKLQLCSPFPTETDIFLSGLACDNHLLIVVDKVIVEDRDWESVDAIVFALVCIFEADGVESVFVKEWNGHEMLKSKADVEAARRRKARGVVDFILNQESRDLIGEFE